MVAAEAVQVAPATTGLKWRGDVIVVGAGIVGLAVAREWLHRHPGARLIVLEKEAEIATHQSGHNSGVIHSGIYYTPGSLKARACVAGAARMMAYCDEHDIAYRLCGKMIIATEEEELPRLDALFERGKANGVPGLEMVDAGRLREIEPHAVGLRALWSPNTGIVDYRQVAQSYANEIEGSGGEIITSAEVIGFERRGKATLLSTTKGDFEAALVVTCAGMWADRVAQLSGADRKPEIIPFRGDYFTLPPERRHLVQTNIYPVPDPRFPFLGVHLTPRMSGEVWMGPNAVLAFARAGYSFPTVNVRDLFGTVRSRGFRRFAMKHWRTGLDETRRDLSRRRFLESLQKFIPELQLSDLRPGPSGVRAQALSDDGELVDDFVFDRSGGALHVRNAPSPAATSSLEIGGMIADEMEAMAI
jgi:(S)-2-hydroxyglutarate dehydrogenase